MQYVIVETLTDESQIIQKNVQKWCAKWKKMWFSQIAGFTYEKGHRYKLRGRKTILANPPADGLAWKYELIEVLEDKEITSHELPVE